MSKKSMSSYAMVGLLVMIGLAPISSSAFDDKGAAGIKTSSGIVQAKSPATCKELNRIYES